MPSASQNWKNRVERGFGTLALIMARNPALWLLGFTLAIGLLASQLMHIRTDTSIEGFLEKDAKEITQYNNFKETFGRDEVFLITIEVEDLFDQHFIDNLRAFHQQIENEVPYVEKVDSLINARHTYGADDTLFIEDLLPEVLPEDPQTLQALKDYTYNNPAYLNFLIAPDGHLTGVAVKLLSSLFSRDEQGNVETTYLTEEHKNEAMRALEKIASEYQGKMSPSIQLSGSVPISLMIAEIVQRDFTLFTTLAIALISILLIFIFRRASGVIMPIIVMQLGVISTISMMALMDTPIQVSTSILPSFLLAVCVGDSIHLLTIFYRHYDSGYEKHIALAKAMEHTGLAILFTSITTAAGLASFTASELTAVAALGFYGALGSMIAFALTVTVLPCMIALLPLKRRPIVEDTGSHLQIFLTACTKFSTTYPKAIVSSSTILFIVAAYFASHINFSHLPMEWVPKDYPAYKAVKNLEARMGGSLAIEVVLDTGKSRGINDARFMQTLEEAMREIEKMKTDNLHVAKVISVTDIIKESNRALHDNNQQHYSIPEDSDLISQELFMVEIDKPEDLYNFIDRDYRLARLTVLMPWVDALYLAPFIADLDIYLNKKFEGQVEEVILTGVTPILGTTFAKMLYSTAESYVLAAFVITLMMVLLIGNVKLGLISMFPSLLPIIIVLALLHFLGISLDMLTMLIGSIAIGLTVDDNVHFMHGFRRVYSRTGDPALAIQETLASSGRAMLITSIVLCVGFGIYTQSEMNNMIIFGATTALCIALALAATFILAPALMMLANKTKAE